MDARLLEHQVAQNVPKPRKNDFGIGRGRLSTSALETGRILKSVQGAASSGDQQDNDKHKGQDIKGRQKAKKDGQKKICSRTNAGFTGGLFPKLKNGRSKHNE